MRLNKTGMFAILILFPFILGGCAAVHTSIAKRDLEVQTRMSKTIFLDPTSEEKKTVYIQVRNTSVKQDLDLEPNLQWALSQRGYTIVRSPEQANYMVQANVLRVAKINVREMDSDLNAGFGGALVGATVAGAAGGDAGAMIGAGLAGAAIGVAIDAMTKDIYYAMVTDVQISERALGTQITEKLNLKPSQDANTKKAIPTKQKDPWMRYQTRIISTANKVNLKFEEAIPELAYEVSSSIAGMM